MRKEYDFSKSVKNPYAKHLRKPVTIRLGTDVVEYFGGDGPGDRDTLPEPHQPLPQRLRAGASKAVAEVGVVN